MDVFVRVHSIWSFFSGEEVRATVVGESKRHYIVEFTDYSYVNFENHALDRPYTHTMKVRKSRCIRAT